jgi:hypothetical protein
MNARQLRLLKRNVGLRTNESVHRGRGSRFYSEWWQFGAPEEIRTPAARFVILARTLQSLRTVTTTKQEWSKNRAKTPNGLRPPITATKPASVTFLEANDRFAPHLFTLAITSRSAPTGNSVDDAKVSSVRNSGSPPRCSRSRYRFPCSSLQHLRRPRIRRLRVSTRHRAVPRCWR